MLVVHLFGSAQNVVFTLNCLVVDNNYFGDHIPLVVNSKKMEDSAAGKQNGLKKTEACLFSLSTQLTTTTVLQFSTIFYTRR